MEGKVWIVARQLFKLLIVEHFAQRTGAVPEADFARAVQALELVENMRTHRRHPGAAADKHHLGVGFFSKELAKRPGNRHLIARLQRPDIG